MSKTGEKAISGLVNKLSKAHREDVQNHYKKNWKIDVSDSDADDLIHALDKQIAGTVKHLDVIDEDLIIQMLKDDEYSVELIEKHNLKTERFNYGLEYHYTHKKDNKYAFVFERHFSYISACIVFSEKPYCCTEPMLALEGDKIVSRDIFIIKTDNLIDYLLSLRFIKDYNYSKVVKLFKDQKKGIIVNNK